MASREIQKYLDATANRDTRDDLRLAVELVRGPKTAIDCGCGAGSDIAFLRGRGFRVHAFDIEPEAIARCRQRFSGDQDVLLSRDAFSTFDYPAVSLIVADASLFFCPRREFATVWRKISQALLPEGIFVGSFLGPEDTMAGAEYRREVYWPDVLVTTEREIRSWFEGFDIEALTEHRQSGHTATGESHRWHVFSVLARKKPAGGPGKRVQATG